MRVKIEGGTALRDEVIECAQLADGNRRLPFTVTFCNSYMDRNRPPLREMEEIAWVLRTDAKRNQVGFVRSSDLKARDRFVLSDDWP